MNRILILTIITLVLLAPFNVYAESSYKMKKESKSIDVELTITPSPLDIEQQSMLGIRFVEKNSNKTQVHVDYVVYIKNDKGEIFRTLQTHTNEGELTIPFRFTSEGDHVIGIEIYAINFMPIPMEEVEFGVSVVPEFPMAVVAVFGSMILLSIIMSRRLLKY